MKKVLMGMAIGVGLILLMGSAYQEYQEYRVISGTLETSTISYQSTISGIGADGECYLAITNVHTGETTLFRIIDSEQVLFGPQALQKGKQGRVIAELY